VIEATAGDFAIVWDNGVVTVRPDLVAEIEADERGPIARTGLAAEALKLRAEIERRLSLPAYDPTALAEDRPFRIQPGGPDHARLVLEALGASIEVEFDDEDDELNALEAEIAAEAEAELANERDS